MCLRPEAPVAAPKLLKIALGFGGPALQHKLVVLADATGNLLQAHSQARKHTEKSGAPDVTHRVLEQGAT
jgi:hypothetical protein